MHKRLCFGKVTNITCCIQIDGTWEMSLRHHTDVYVCVCVCLLFMLASMFAILAKRKSPKVFKSSFQVVQLITADFMDAKTECTISNNCSWSSYSIDLTSKCAAVSQ